jgi:hypothetical protein
MNPCFRNVKIYGAMTAILLASSAWAQSAKVSVLALVLSVSWAL